MRPWPRGGVFEAGSEPVGTDIRPPFGTPLRGRFVMPYVNPVATPQCVRDGCAGRFFMDELDAVWLHGKREDAERLLTDYLSAGYNHIPVGSVGPESYSGHYPEVHWIAEGADKFAAYLSWLVSHGCEYTLVVLPDRMPWFLGQGIGWDWDAIERDVTPILSHPTVVALTHYAMLGWEIFGTKAESAKGFAYMKRLYPQARRANHNPLDHLCPGASNEGEEESVRECVASGMTDHDVQSPSPDDSRFRNPNHPGVDDGGLTCLEGAYRWNVGDMARRLQGIDAVGTGPSPWVEPVLTPDGHPTVATYGECLAHRDYWEGRPTPDDGPLFRAKMLSIPGVVHILDA